MWTAARLMHDNTIPGETRLALYLSARYLQELETALRLVGVTAQYLRPGIENIMLPRLTMAQQGQGNPHRVICARTWQLTGANPDWWFEWWQWWNGTRERICRIANINTAAQLIAAQLHSAPP